MQQHDKVSAELLEELERWQRPFSPLTVFAATVKNETPDADKGAGGDKTSDPDAEFEAMYGDLPEAVQLKLKEVSTLKQQQAEQQKQLELIQGEARKHQSRADQAFAKLQAHNLLDQGPQAKGIEADPVYQEIIADLKAEGVPAENLESAARVQYKIHQRAVKANSQNFQNYIAPMAQSLGTIEADRFYSMARNNDKDGYFADPEVDAYVRQELNNLVATGSEINDKTIDFLLLMGIGNKVRSGGKAPITQHQQPVNFSTRNQPMNTGAVSNGGAKQFQNSNVPQARHEHTQRGVDTIVGLWKRDLPKGGKK
jgi:hypothetical protein